MKNSILFSIRKASIILLLLLFASKAQGGSDDGNAVLQISDGGYLIVGSTSYGAGGSDIYVVRTDSIGNKIWSKTIGQVSPDYGYAVAESGDGGFVIVGNTIGLLTDVYLIKIDSMGNLLWSKTLGWGLYEGANSIQKCSDGGFIIGGATRSFTTVFLGSDFLLIKTDSDGNPEWTKVYGTSNSGLGFSVSQCSDNGFILTGYTLTNYDSIIIGPDDPVILLIKTDSLGDMEWSRTYVENVADYAYSVLQTTDGGFIITGDGYSNFIRRVFLIKTDSLGNVEWIKKYNKSQSYANKVRQCEDGGFVIVGHDFNSSNGTENEVYLFKTDSDGSLLWSKTFGGNDVDAGRDVRQTNDKGFIITGRSSSFGGGNEHMYLLKTDSLGTLQWSNTYGDVAGKTGATQEEDDLDSTDESLAWTDLIATQDTNCYTDETSSLVVGAPTTIISTPPDSFAAAATIITSGGTFVGIPIFLDSVFCGTSVGTAQEEFKNLNYNLSNYPNPFGSVTTIEYDVPKNAKEAVIVIYDIIAGNIVKTMSLETRGSGTVEFNSKQLAGGIYVYGLKIDGTVVFTKKMVIVR
jgi:hypothetical protein